MERPALVDLAGAAQSEGDLQAELVFASEAQWRKTDPTITPDDMGDARQRVHTTQEVLQKAKEHLQTAEAGHRGPCLLRTWMMRSLPEAQAVQPQGGSEIGVARVE